MIIRPYTLRRPVRLVLAVALALAALPCIAQTLNVERGGSESPTTGESSYAFKVGYRQSLHGAHLLFSFDYLNEGHFEGHHRDGYGLVTWFSTAPIGNDRLRFSAGAGPYYFFDTITAPGGSSQNYHGLAPLVALAAQGSLHHHWDWTVSANAMRPTHDLRTTTMTVGVAYQLTTEGPEARTRPIGLIDLIFHAPPRAEPAADAVPRERDELSLYGAFSVINNIGNPHAWGGSVEYRYRFENHLEATAAYIYEGDPRVARRSGLAVQGWPVRTDFLSRVDIGVGIGAYVFIDTKRQSPAGAKPCAAVAPVISIMFSAPLWHDRYFARFIWDRVISNYDRDADLWRLGIGRTL